MTIFESLNDDTNAPVTIDGGTAGDRIEKGEPYWTLGLGQSIRVFMSREQLAKLAEVSGAAHSAIIDANSHDVVAPEPAQEGEARIS